MPIFRNCLFASPPLPALDFSHLPLHNPPLLAERKVSTHIAKFSIPPLLAERRTFASVALQFAAADGAEDFYTHRRVFQFLLTTPKLYS